MPHSGGACSPGSTSSLPGAGLLPLQGKETFFEYDDQHTNIYDTYILLLWAHVKINEDLAEKISHDDQAQEIGLY